MTWFWQLIARYLPIYADDHEHEAMQRFAAAARARPREYVESDHHTITDTGLKESTYGRKPSGPDYTC